MAGGDRNITPLELRELLLGHAKWLARLRGGRRLNMHFAMVGRVDLSGLVLKGSDIVGSQMRNCRLAGVDLSASNLFS